MKKMVSDEFLVKFNCLAPKSKNPLMDRVKKDKFKSKEIHTAQNKIEELMGADGKIRNVWFVPHFVQVLEMFFEDALITQIRVLTTAVQVGRRFT